MPERDKHGRLCGFLEIEEYTDAWRRRFVLLDEANLKFFKGKDTMQESIEEEAIVIIDLVYITKVAITTNKPKADYCFEIHTASQKWYLRSNNESEIEEWFKVLHKAAVNPKRDSDDRDKDSSNFMRGGSVKSTASCDTEDGYFDSEPQSNVSYETKIIGGIPVRTVKKTNGDTDSLSRSCCNSGSDSIKPIKGGYCIKQGAVMKNWKRRYFRLDMFKFCYYEKETDKEPIRSLSATNLRGVKPHAGPTFNNKPHVFEVETPQRTYYIQEHLVFKLDEVTVAWAGLETGRQRKAESDEEMQEWIKAFRHVIRSIKGKSSAVKIDSLGNLTRIPSFSVNPTGRFAVNKTS